MVTTVISISPFRKVHDINVKSKNGRNFVIDIYEISNGSYESEVTVLDNISSNKGSWLYKTLPSSSSANDNFKASVDLIDQYLSSVDNADSIIDVHNPCNCPFVPEADQNSILVNLGHSFSVRVN